MARTKTVVVSVFGGFCFFFLAYQVFSPAPCPPSDSPSSNENGLAERTQLSLSSEAVCRQFLDVGYFLINSNQTAAFSTSIKSLLFHRSAPINLHVFTLPELEFGLKTLLDTWRLSFVELQLHVLDHEWLDQVQWLQGSGMGSTNTYELAKLAIPALLPASVTKLILVGSNTLFAKDVRSLWTNFLSFHEEQCFAVVDRQGSHQPHSSLILMAISKLRKTNWNEMWADLARPLLGSSTKITFDFMFAKLAQEHSNLFGKLPCSWNVQISSNIDRECLKNAALYSGFQRQHTLIRNHFVTFAYEVYATFEDMDGTSFRRSQLDMLCPHRLKDIPHDHAVEQEFIKKHGECYDFYQSSTVDYRIHPFFFDFNFTEFGHPLPSKLKSPVAGLEVSVVTQFSFDRFYLFERLMRSWKGPVSAAIFASDSEAAKLRDSFYSSPYCWNRTNIALHVVFREKSAYPVNILRNIALQMATTSHVFLLDVDFIPKTWTQPRLRNTLRTLKKKVDKLALIVPAFETFNEKLKIPFHKEDAVRLYEQGELVQFHVDHYDPGHGPTNFKKWTQATEAYKIQWAEGFEPYVVVPRTCPKYDERFIGYDFNKVAQVEELQAAGYQFWVESKTFLVHLPHSKVSTLWVHPKNYETCNDLAKEEFRKELVAKYGEYVPEQIFAEVGR
eukprot:m.19974 g.19974  ORF g.19974 m.19974 type:complete len:671 (+) comp12356_c0_seq2:41-2053(+)